MHQTIGEFIRQTRREHDLTQSELGGERFSKSYVSAVERNKIVSSSAALRFFAEQLGQPRDYFTSLLEEVDEGRQLSVLDAPGSLSTSDSALQRETLTLLDILLESTELYNVPTLSELPTLSPEVISALPAHKQARYYFLMGLLARNKGDLSRALYAFEYALALAPDKHRPAILDEMGVNYYTAKAYQAALGYHLRALDLLQKESGSNALTRLRFKVELHCGDDYCALGAYRQARDHYERARLDLNAEHDLKTAGLLYIGLGYCTYVLIRRSTALTIPVDERASFQEMEREFQRAVSFLLQGRSVYQVSSDKMAEASARLTLAQVLLDFSTRQRQMVQEKARAIGSETAANCATLLNEAEEQCRQVLLVWQDPSCAVDTSADLDTVIYMALACLIRIALQRATLARLNGYTDTAYRERAMASSLCQQILDSLSERSLHWTLVHNATTLQADGKAYHSPSLPRLANLFDEHSTYPHSPMSQVEVYFAAGEVAEEFGRLAMSYDYCHDCYTRATQFFRAALNGAHSIKEDDPGYVLRCYEYCACLYEERLLASPELAVETMKTLMNTLKEEVLQLRTPYVDKALY